MSVSDEGTQHSDYIYQRDKQLKDKYNNSNKNYRILPEISKVKVQLTDKEHTIASKLRINDDTENNASDEIILKEEETDDHLQKDDDAHASSLDEMKVSVDDKRREGGVFTVYLQKNNKKNTIYQSSEGIPNKGSNKATMTFMKSILIVMIVSVFALIIRRCVKAQEQF